MGSYLSFYVVPKRKTQQEPKKYVRLMEFSRNTDIYNAFTDTLQIAYAGTEDIYTTLTYDDVQEVVNDLKKSIEYAKTRLYEYEKYASSNPDYIQDIIDTKEYIKDLEEAKSKTSFIADIADSSDSYDNEGIEELCCNTN